MCACGSQRTRSGYIPYERSIVVLLFVCCFVVCFVVCCFVVCLFVLGCGFSEAGSLVDLECSKELRRLSSQLQLSICVYLSTVDRPSWLLLHGF